MNGAAVCAAILFCEAVQCCTFSTCIWERVTWSDVIKREGSWSDEVLDRRECCGPRIVVGDFNEWTRGLASRLIGDAFEAVDPKKFLRDARSYPGVLPVLHLDHFYYEKQLSLKSFRLDRSRKALIASDHVPMVAEFESLGT